MNPLKCTDCGEEFETPDVGARYNPPYDCPSCKAKSGETDWPRKGFGLGPTGTVGARRKK